MTRQGWRVAYWAVAGVGVMSAALAWLAIVEPRTLLRKAKTPVGTAPPRPALLAVLRKEVAGMLRDFWTVLKVPTFLVLMTEVQSWPDATNLPRPRKTRIHRLNPAAPG